MDLRSVALVVVTVLALSSEVYGSNVPEFCSQPPVPGFEGSPLRKWGFFPSEQKCKEFTWGGIAGNGNVFDNEQACLDTCRRIRPQNTKKYILTPGQCVCTCPNCNYEPRVTSTMKPVVTTSTNAPVTALPLTRSPATPTKPATTVPPPTKPATTVPPPTESGTKGNWFTNFLKF